jgi:hypothetical protein
MIKTKSAAIPNVFSLAPLWLTRAGDRPSRCGLVLAVIDPGSAPSAHQHALRQLELSTQQQAHTKFMPSRGNEIGEHTIDNNHPDHPQTCFLT